jgi:flagellar L-ring protein precursor FlgH
MMRRLAALALCSGLCLGAAAPAVAADLFTPGNWGALASDRLASRVGDTLTVVIDETSTASDSATNGTSKNSTFSGLLGGGATSYSGQLQLNSGFNGTGQTQRAHKMVAQISVVVDRVLPNGDLHVTGTQVMHINGERTNIRVNGRVRLADIASDNTVLSTRLADATIDYDGAGFIDRNDRPGLLSRLFSFLGLP